MAYRLRFLNLKKLYNFAALESKQKFFFQERFSTSLASHASSFWNSKSFLFKLVAVSSGFGLCSGLWTYLAAPERKNRRNVLLTERSDFTAPAGFDKIKPSRVVPGPASDLGLDLMLFQYQTCPFCCKVRAFLDFYGVPYKIVEVNPVMRQQLKDSKYKKVPILVAQEKESPKKLQLNDSSVIISILGTLLMDVSEGLESILKYYIPLIYTNDDGKEIEEVMNKYFLMFGDRRTKKNDEIFKSERKWRKWADTDFVHVLSPNIYRTFDEALKSFHYFSDVGEWEKNFSTIERMIVIYVGATAMYFVGKRLKKKHSLKDDVRQSLYDMCKMWTKEIGPNKKFMGGDVPNLADLSVYGMLSSIEGCLAFKDLLENTNIGTWYNNVKKAVVNHQGYELLRI